MVQLRIRCDVRSIPDVASTQSEAIQTQYAFSADFQNLGSLMQDVIDATPDLERLHAAAMDPQTATAFTSTGGVRKSA